MFVWMSGFYNPLAHTHFNMFVDEWTSANESPVSVPIIDCQCLPYGKYVFGGVILIWASLVRMG